MQKGSGVAVEAALGGATRAWLARHAEGVPVTLLGDEEHVPAEAGR